MVAAAYHLRHAGPRRTAVLTGRYLRDRLEGLRSGRVVRKLAGVARSGRRSAETDVMFGLMILQRQLNDLQQQLTDVQDHLGRIEGRLDSAGPVGAAARSNRASTDRSGTSSTS